MLFIYLNVISRTKDKKQKKIQLYNFPNAIFLAFMYEFHPMVCVSEVKTND